MDKKIAENSVEYWIYPFGQTNFDDILSFVLSECDEYIWHNDGFRLNERDFPTRHFFGRTNFGENNDDEWFIVHLMLQISVKFSDVVIRIQDSDGDFLLIEAADFLPRWMDSSSVNMQNRVFLHNGAVHVVPRLKKSGRAKNKPAADDVIIPAAVESPQLGARLVFDHPELTVADSSLHLCIEKKVGDLVDHLRGGVFHYANCYLPANLAFVLSERPNFVSPAVQAFYLRLPDDLKFCRECKYFPHSNLVRQKVKFTRHLYAMLSQQKYSLDRRSTWPMPLPTDPSFNDHALGLKLTCGFEIICRRNENKMQASDKPLATSDWLNFLDRLKSSGYFQSEVEGSAKYATLLYSARTFFEENLANSSRDVGDLIAHLMAEYPENFYEKARVEGERLTASDDDGWLNVTPKMLDEAFEKVSKSNGEIFEEELYGSKSPGQKNRSNAKNDIKNKVKNFIVADASFEGASARNTGSSKKKVESKKPVHAMIDLRLPDSSSDSSDMDSYGSDEASDSDLHDDELEQMKDWQNAMRDYMRQMDSELGKTEVGRTFTNCGSKVPVKKHMELQCTSKRSASPGSNSIDDEDDGFSAVDVDKNLVTNLLSAYKSEEGVPGPASTLLHGLDILPSKLNRALDSDDDEDM